MSELTIIGIAICIIAFIWTWAMCALAGRADDEMDELHGSILQRDRSLRRRMATGTDKGGLHSTR